MSIADRIQHLRKSKGISQEELADKIGVSRQAVSKWESDQSMPDIEKIILLSDFFEVTTDYLLKGIEPVPDNSGHAGHFGNSENSGYFGNSENSGYFGNSENSGYSDNSGNFGNPDNQTWEKEKADAVIFTIIGTAFNFIGLITAAMIWYDEQRAIATAVGLLFLVIGCMIYSIGMVVSDRATKGRAKQLFWKINVWTVTFIPFSMICNLVSGVKGAAPYPLLVGSRVRYALFWIIYFTIGAGADLMIHRAGKQTVEKVI